MMGVVEVRDGDILHVADNAATAAFFGATPEATRGRWASELGVPEAHRARWVEAYRQSAAGGAPVSFRYLHDGSESERWLQATVTHVGGDWFIYYVEEVTERLAIDEALRGHVARQVALLRALPDLIFRVDAAGRYLDVHAPDPAALAAPAEALVGRMIGEVLPPDLSARFDAAITRALATEEVECVVYDLVVPSGEGRVFEARVSPDVERDEALIIVRDLTEQHASRRIVAETAERLQTLVASLQAGVLVEDETGKVLLANERFCELLELDAPPGALVGVDCRQAVESVLALSADPEAVGNRIGETLHAREAVMAERVDFADGRVLERDYVPITLDGAYRGHLWLYHDVTERVVSEAQRRRREARYRLLAENMQDLVALHAPDGTYEWLSPSVEILLGYRSDELVGTNPHDLFHPDDVESVRGGARTRVGEDEQGPSIVYRIRHRDGRYVWLETLTTPILDDAGAVVQLQTSSRDVSERQEMAARLHHQAYYDPLTGLPNRALFSTRLEDAVAARSSGAEFAVLYLDLDRFKVVNDTMGHSAGDALLQEVAVRLRRVVRADDTVARIGGDEFAVLLPSLPEPAYAERAARRVLDALAAPADVGGREVYTGASVGVVVGRADHAGPDALLREADFAMYEAKGAGRGRMVVYSEDVHEQVTRRLRLEMDLRHAVEREELRVLYQPIVRLSDGALAGFEALVRWEHPDLGRLAPDAFLGPARDSGQLAALDRWVLDEACRVAAAFDASRGRGAAPLRLNVNCTGHDLLADGYVEGVLDVLARHGLRPGGLSLELTEQVLVADADSAAAAFLRLQRGGVAIALDDFGTGYSSLSMLHALPVNTVKVDRSFVREMTGRNPSRQLVETVVQLGRILDKEVVAEGIEEARQLAMLQRLGCAYGQGYLFARPLETEAALALAAAEASPWQAHWRGDPAAA